MRLNTAQRLALNIDSHIVIDAGAGTGVSIYRQNLMLHMCLGQWHEFMQNYVCTKCNLLICTMLCDGRSGDEGSISTFENCFS